VSLSKNIKHIIDFKLPPKEAIKYLEKKGYKLTFDYHEMIKEAHHKAFTVAKVQRLDLLSDIKESILQAQKEGLSFSKWQKNIKPILIKKGWWGEVDAIDKKTGEVKSIFVGKKRLKTIFYTNTRVAYQVAKAKRYYANPNVKYLKYVAVLDSSTRDSHKALHGTILPKDDEFWKTHFPPNGWNCRCRVVAVPKHKKPTPTDKTKLPKDSVHPDWAYDIREGRFFDRFSGGDEEIKAFSDYKDFGLKSASELKEKNLPPAPALLPKEKTKEEALKVLIKEILKDKKEMIVQTPITDTIIDISLLRHSIFDNSDNREQFARLVLPTLQEPDEIWAQRIKGKYDTYFKKRYRFIKIFKEKKTNSLVVVELRRDGSLFWTFFKPSSLKKIDGFRKGILMWFDKLKWK